MGEKIALSIAGFDPTGGAGVLVDVKVFSLFGLKACGIPTTLTIQTTSIFKSWQSVNPEYLKETLKSLVNDLPICGVKIGMIGTSENAYLIGDFLKKYKNKFLWVILDPVLKATLNYPLYSSEEFLKILKTKIFPFVDIITPNVFEAQNLSNINIKKKKDFLNVAKYLHSLGPKIIIIKGWETKNFVWDFFYSQEKSFFSQRKKILGSFHGTGCVFSSAILSYLLLGFSPDKAFKKAKNWLYLKLKKEVVKKIGGKIWLFL